MRGRRKRGDTWIDWTSFREESWRRGWTSFVPTIITQSAEKYKKVSILSQSSCLLPTLRPQILIQWLVFVFIVSVTLADLAIAQTKVSSQPSTSLVGIAKTLSQPSQKRCTLLFAHPHRTRWHFLLESIYGVGPSGLDMPFPAVKLLTLAPEVEGNPPFHPKPSLSRGNRFDRPHSILDRHCPLSHRCRRDLHHAPLQRDGTLTTRDPGVIGLLLLFPPHTPFLRSHRRRFPLPPMFRTYGLHLPPPPAAS